MDITANQQQSFSFPLLKNAEILQCMSDLGIPLTESEILEPNRHKEAVRNLFIRLVETGLGISEEELFTPPPHMVKQRDTLPYPDLHEDSLTELAFLKASIKLMTACGVSDFGVKDLQGPTSRRLRRQLSGAINLFKFRDDKLQLYSELIEHRNSIVVNLEQTREENMMLNQQLEETKITCANEWRAIEEVENDCVEIEKEITQNNKLQSSIRQENAELKKKANELMDKTATAALALQEVQNEEQKLSGQVVQSPERIKRELSEASTALEIERKEISDAERDEKVSKMKITNLVKAKDDITKVMQIMEEVQAEMSKHSGVVEEVQNARASVEKNLRSTKEINDVAEDSESQICRIEEKITHLRKQGKVKMAAAQQALHKAKKELLDVEKDRREGMARVEAGEAEVYEMELIIQEEKEKAEREIAETIRAYKRVESAILQHDKSFMAAIDCA